MHIVLVPEAIVLIHTVLRFDPAFYVSAYTQELVQSDPTYGTLKEATNAILLIDFIRLTIPVFIFTVSWRYILLHYRGWRPVLTRLAIVTLLDLVYLGAAFYITEDRDHEARMSLFINHGRESCSKPDVLIGAGPSACGIIEDEYYSGFMKRFTNLSALHAWLRLGCHVGQGDKLLAMEMTDREIYYAAQYLKRNRNGADDELARRMLTRITDAKNLASLDSTIGKTMKLEPDGDTWRRWFFPSECDYIVGGIPTDPRIRLIELKTEAPPKPD